MSDPFFLVVASVLGAVIGSFLNAVVYRLPRRGLEPLGKRSVCPACKAPIPGWFNIPILGWLWLRGRAKCCGARISVQYPFVEALTAVLFLGLAWRPPSGLPLTESAGFEAFAAFGFHAYFLSVLIAGTFIDLEHRLLPFRLTKPLMFVGPIAAIAVPGIAGFLVEGDRVPPMTSSLLSSIVGMAVGYWMTRGIEVGGKRLFKKDAMGGGDVKLMGGVGAFLGWEGALLTFFIGCVVGAFVGAARMVASRDPYIPFGPFLAIGAALTLFFRGPILDFLTVTWPEWQREHMSSPLLLGGVAVVCCVLLFVLIRRGRNT